MTIDLSPSQARRKWLTENQEHVRRFAGDTIPNFDAKWNALKHSTEYTADTGDFFLPAATNSLQHSILIFNTRHEFAHDPIAVVKTDKLANTTPRTNIPIVVAYDGSHYEHLIPVSEGDILKTINLVDGYTSGKGVAKWDHDHILRL